MQSVHHLYVKVGCGGVALHPSSPPPLSSSDGGDLLVLGGLLDGRLLADELLEALEPHVLHRQVAHARLAAVQQAQRVAVLQLRVAHALVHHQVQQLVRRVVQHLVVLPAGGDRAQEELERRAVDILIDANGTT